MGASDPSAPLLLTLPGGPSLSGVDMAADLAAALPEAVRARYVSASIVVAEARD